VVSASSVFPAQTCTQQLISTLPVDLVEQTCRRLSGGEGGQARFRIVDTTITGAIGAH
jgi:hypothetical protein